MSDIKWIKIITDIFDDEKILLIEEMPDSDAIIVIWFKLLCLAGKQNNSGVFVMNDKIPYTEKMLATIFRRKESTVHLALQVFEQFGMIQIVNGAITIPNWGKHQTMDKLEKKSEYMKNYMQNYREKQKEIACKTNSKSNCKANVSLEDIDNKDLEGDIIAFWIDVNNYSLSSYQIFEGGEGIVSYSNNITNQILLDFNTFLKLIS